MIYISCPKPASPSGGVWFLYKIVELLNELGHRSILVKTEPFDIWWSARQTRNEFSTSEPVSLGQDDILIVPEVLWPQPPRVSVGAGVRKVLFVQNRIWLPQEMETYHGGVAETLVCSRYLANYMKREHKSNVIGKVTPFLDDGLWQPTPKTANKTLVLARRNPYHAKTKAALEAEGFPVDYVTEPLTQRELSRRLESCEFYVHLTHPEGFPMQALEAMRSGTIVCGTTGGGGNEIMHHKETSWVVQDPENGHYGSADEFVRRIMEGMLALRSDADLRSRMWQMAHNWSLRYNADATKEELRGIFGRQ